MITIRYTAWDGSQRVQLSADKVFQELADHLSATDDMRQAMDKLMRQGVEGENDEKLKGLDDLVRDLREQMRERYRQANLDSSLDEMQDKLNQILNQERNTLQQHRPQKPELQKNEEFLDRLPQRMSDKMEKLSRYPFEDEAAKRRLTNSCRSSRTSVLWRTFSGAITICLTAPSR